MVLAVAGFIVPRMFNIFVSRAARAAADKNYIPGVTFEHLPPSAEGMEKGEEHEHYPTESIEQESKLR